MLRNLLEYFFEPSKHRCALSKHYQYHSSQYQFGPIESRVPKIRQ